MERLLSNRAVQLRGADFLFVNASAEPCHAVPLPGRRRVQAVSGSAPELTPSCHRSLAVSPFHAQSRLHGAPFQVQDLSLP